MGNEEQIACASAGGGVTRPEREKGRNAGRLAVGEGRSLLSLWWKHYWRSIAFRIGNSEQRFILTPSVLNHIARHQQSDGTSSEAGGQLFARFKDEQIRVERATGPRATDRRSRYEYIPDRRGEQEEIDKMHSRKLHFIGDWHSLTELLKIAEVEVRTRMKRANLYRLIQLGQFPAPIHLGGARWRADEVEEFIKRRTEERDRELGKNNFVLRPSILPDSSPGALNDAMSADKSGTTPSQSFSTGRMLDPQLCEALRLLKVDIPELHVDRLLVTLSWP